MTDSGFTVDVDQNQYLPEGGRDVSAVVTVTSGADVAIAAPGAGAGSAEIIIIDCSGSMDYPPTKMSQARAATAAAIDVVRDGVGFAVVAGTSTAWPVFPPDGSMAVASPASRAAAKQAVGALRANGGTAIGKWLGLARQIFAGYPAQLRHAILLTDGKNQHETPEQLVAELGQCEGVFSCDCRGVGTDWEVSELRTVSSALLGTVDIVPDPAGLAADFAAMMENAMGKQVADVSLRVWTPQTATLKFVKQVAPAVEDLTGRRTQFSPQAGDFPTGAWGPGESRDYHVGVEVAAAGLGQEMLAARISLVAGTEVLGQGLVRAIWTDDEALSTKINARVAHYTGQAELADAIQEGLEARKQGDEETATAKLGRAVALAHQSGNEDTAKLLAKVVDVVDVESGTVRLKKKVEDADEMALDTRSTKTVRVKKYQRSGEEAAMAVCPNGHDSASDDFCDVCGMRIGGPPAGSSSAASGHGAPGGAPGSWPAPGPASADEPCPNCGTPRTGQFCEACGYNFAGPRFSRGAPPPGPGPASPAPGGGYSQPVPSSPSRPQPPPPGPGTGGYSWSQPVPSAPSSPAPPAATLPPPARQAAAGAPSMSSFPYPQATWTAVVGADRAYYERVQAVTGPEGAAVTFPSYYAERRFQLVGNQMRIGRRSVSRGLAPEIDLTGPPADPGISRLHAVLIATQDGNWAVLDPGSANGTLVNGAEIGVGDQISLHDGDRINLGAWTAITVHRGLGNSQLAGGRRHVTTDDPRH